MTRPIPRPAPEQAPPTMLRLSDVVALTQISESTLMRAAVLRWIDHIDRIVSGEALGNVVEMRGR